MGGQKNLGGGGGGASTMDDAMRHEKLKNFINLNPVRCRCTVKKITGVRFLKHLNRGDLL